MTANHGYFEFLCALAACDELTGPELVKLREHSLQCAFCTDRILEMIKVHTSLLLSHAFNHRKERLPEGMRERFIARAIKEGVPLKAPSTIGFGTLGLASALFIVLLVTAAALKRGPLSRPAVDIGHFDAAQLSKPVPATNLMPPDSATGLLPRRREPSRSAKSRSVLVEWRLDPSHDAHVKKPTLPGHPDIFQNRYFPAGLSLPHDTLATIPSDVGRLSSWPYMPSRFTLAIPPAWIREGALQLLADSEHSTSDSAAFPSQFTFTTRAAQGLHPPIFKFSGTPLKFRFAETVTQ